MQLWTVPVNVSQSYVSRWEFSAANIRQFLRGPRSTNRNGFSNPTKLPPAAINRQINLELYASYVYLSMAYYFDRDDKSLSNFAKFFHAQSKQECEHAEKLMSLQNMRGGRIFLQDIRKPDRDEWGSGLEALECSLQLEKSVNQSLLDLQKMATEHNDPHMCDFIETHYLDEQVKSIKQLSDWISNLRSMGAPESGMAEYLFDKHTMADEGS